MNNELREALELLEKEKGIPKAALLGAIENSLQTACKNHFGTSDNIRVTIDPETCDFSVVSEKTVVEEVVNPTTEISLAEARLLSPKHVVGDVIQSQIDSKSFGRIATQNAKGVIVQKIREEERRVLYNEYFMLEKDIVTGTVQRDNGKSIVINLGRCDASLMEMEQVKNEVLRPNDRVKVYVVEVKDSPRGPRIMVSRTHPDLVKRLFEQEVTEVKEGIVEIKAIAREAGSRTKMAVKSNDPNVDPVGACVGMNGIRVNAVVDELKGEKIDIINWDDNPAYLIENALSPAKVIAVVADEESREALVIVPDYQLSLAIGKEGQNARLAARLTNYKIDIKSESQAAEAGLFDDMNAELEESELLDKPGEGFGDASDFDELEEFPADEADFDALQNDAMAADEANGEEYSGESLAAESAAEFAAGEGEAVAEATASEGELVSAAALKDKAEALD